LTAREYHDRTTHSPASIRTSGHTLEWDIKPFPFKVYTDLPAIPLPRELDPLGIDTLAALAEPAPAAASLSLSQLAAVLYYAAGVTKKKTYPGGGEVLFRAAASTGALYQTEVSITSAPATSRFAACAAATSAPRSRLPPPMTRSRAGRRRSC